MIARLVVILTLSFLMQFSTAFAASPAIGFLQKTIGKYNTSSSVQSEVSKKVFLSVLEETKSSEGKLFYAKKAMRIELKGEEKSLIVMNKDNIWLETSGMTDEDKPQVTKILAKDMIRQARSPIALIFGKSAILNEFKVKSDTTESEVRKISLVPKDTKKWKDLQKFFAEVNVKSGAIDAVQYEDENGNITTYRFSDTKFDAKLDKKIFDYKPPQGAEVTVFQ